MTNTPKDGLNTSHEIQKDGLLGCPFCNELIRNSEFHRDLYVHSHNGCFLQSMSITSNLLERWNTRATTPSATGQMREALEPFAAAFDLLERNNYLPVYLWAFPTSKFPVGQGSIGTLLNSEDLRKARAALTLPDEGRGQCNAPAEYTGAPQPQAANVMRELQSAEALKQGIAAFTNLPERAEAVALAREANNILQGNISRTLKLEKPDYDRLVKILVFELPAALASPPNPWRPDREAVHKIAEGFGLSLSECSRLTDMLHALPPAQPNEWRIDLENAPVNKSVLVAQIGKDPIRAHRYSFDAPWREHGTGNILQGKDAPTHWKPLDAPPAQPADQVKG